MVNRNDIVINLILLLFFQISFYSKFANSQIVTGEDSKIHIQEGMRIISKVSKPYEKQIIDSINLKLIEHPNIHLIRTYKTDQAKYIEISKGFSSLIESFAVAFTIEKHLKKENHGLGFIEHMHETWETNKLVRRQSAFSFGGVRIEDLELSFQNGTFVSDVHAFYRAFIWYALAHEIGHQVLGHDSTIDERTLVKRRKQEAEADLWANEVFSELGFPPAIGFPILYYWHFFDKLNVKNESLRTHPAELRRLRKMLFSSISNFEKWSVKSNLSKDTLEKILDSIKFALLTTKNEIAKQSNFDSSVLTDVLYKKCYRELTESCVKLCTNQSQTVTKCEEKLCVDDIQKNARKLDCFEIASEFIEKRKI